MGINYHAQDPGHACYASCNPDDLNGSTFRCTCNSGSAVDSDHDWAHQQHSRHRIPCDVVGRAQISKRYVNCSDQCEWPNDQWKSDLSKRLGGIWYSTTTMSNCDEPEATSCRWRALELVATINASCANERVLRAIVAKNPKCFAKCPKGDLEARGDCATLCLFQTMLGKSKSFPNSTLPGMAPEELDAPVRDAGAVLLIRLQHATLFHRLDWDSPQIEIQQ
jgi:hypothetical protein